MTYPNFLQETFVQVSDWVEKSLETLKNQLLRIPIIFLAPTCMVHLLWRGRQFIGLFSLIRTIQKSHFVRVKENHVPTYSYVKIYVCVVFIHKCSMKYSNVGIKSYGKWRTWWKSLENWKILKAVENSGKVWKIEE